MVTLCAAQADPQHAGQPRRRTHRGAEHDVLVLSAHGPAALDSVPLVVVTSATAGVEDDADEGGIGTGGAGPG